MSTPPVDPQLARLEQIAAKARELGIETALIGPLAVAAHGYLRATQDADLGTYIEPRPALATLRDAIAALGFKVELAGRPCQRSCVFQRSGCPGRAERVYDAREWVG